MREEIEKTIQRDRKAWEGEMKSEKEKKEYKTKGKTKQQRREEMHEQTNEARYALFLLTRN